MFYRFPYALRYIEMYLCGERCMDSGNLYMTKSVLAYAEYFPLYVLSV